MNHQKQSFYRTLFFIILSSTTAHITAMLTDTYQNTSYHNPISTERMMQLLNDKALIEMYLHHAAANNDDRTLTKLINHSGVNVNATNSYTGDTALHEATRYGHYEAANTLLIYGAKVNAQNRDGDTPLHMAIYSQNNIKCVKLLIHYGASQKRKNVKSYWPDSYLAQEMGRTPIEGIAEDRNDFIPAVHRLLLHERLEGLQLTYQS
jgi:ankyrin repeat protein